MKRFTIQSVIIIVAFLSVFFWQKSDLASYTVPALGILTSLYLISTIRRNHAGYRNQALTVFLLTTSSLLLIQTTGSLNSFLFFLLYFLGFYIGFTFLPETVFVFSLAVIAFFLPRIEQHTFLNIAQIASLLLISPLAYFFGKTITSREKELNQAQILKENIHKRSEDIIMDVSNIVKHEGKTLKDVDVERLKDIVNQSKHLEKETSE